MRLNRAFVKLPRQFDAAALASEVAALPASAWIPHPGRIPGNDAVPLITPGGAVTNAFQGQMAPTDHLRACPYMLEIMADLGGVWGRSRLMGLAAGADVPEHIDVGYYWRTHLRIHIPIITTPKVQFTCDGQSVHMAAGECWAFDSFRPHNVHNGGADKRVHLVIDTVGGERFWDLLTAAQVDDGGEAHFVSPGSVGSATVAFEQANAPEIMSPWEVRCHIDYLMGQAGDAPARDAVGSRLDRFANTWMAAWAQFGPPPAGADAYRVLIDGIRGDLRDLRADTVSLTNGVPIDRALNELIFMVAVPAQPPHLAVAANG